MLMQVKSTTKQGILSFELFNQIPELLSACSAEEGLGYPNRVGCQVVPELLSNPFLRATLRFFRIFPALVSVWSIPGAGALLNMEFWFQLTQK